MPPKRKAGAPGVLVPRNIKVAKKKHETAMTKFSEENCRTWFDKYADSDNKDLMTPDGCQSFFKDLGVSIESITPLVIGYKMKAPRMGYIEWSVWLEIMKYHLCTEKNGKFKTLLEGWEKDILANPDEFRKFYLYTFNYAKSTGQKSMDVETATALWTVMFGEKYPIIKSFNEFMQTKKPVKVVNKDQWSSMFDFCLAVPEDLSNYDSTSSWPVLFDDYVEWRQENM